VERRAQNHHRERLGEALSEEMETIIEGELGDPRIGLVNVTEVHLAGDGRSAHVLVAVEGNEKEAVSTLEGLTAACGFIRHELVKRLRLRRAPELVFRIDLSRQYQARINDLLKRTKKNG